jgi:hypothetical protein
VSEILTTKMVVSAAFSRAILVDEDVVDAEEAAAEKAITTATI